MAVSAPCMSPASPPRTCGRSLVGQIDERSKLYTDDAGQYRHMGRDFDHKAVRHKHGEYVRGDAHTNTVENYFSILKAGYHQLLLSTSAKPICIGIWPEFDFRYSNREGMGVGDESRTEIALKGFRGKRLTYETTQCRSREESPNPQLAFFFILPLED